MTKLKVGIVSVIVAAAIAVPVIMQHQAQTKLRVENEALRQKAEQVEILAAENERLAELVARVERDFVPPKTNDLAKEVVKLRGDVGRLQQEKANAVTAKANGPSVLNEMMTPEMKKMIREQNKVGLSMAYKTFVNQTKLPKEQAEKLNDALADNVMDNVDRITEVLRDGKTEKEMEEIFAAQEKMLSEKIRTLLSEDEFAQYEEYTRNLTSSLTAEVQTDDDGRQSGERGEGETTRAIDAGNHTGGAGGGGIKSRFSTCADA